MTGSAKRGDNNPKAAAKRQPGQRPLAGPALDRGIQAQIGDKLRVLYGELSDQPLPDRLVAILNELDQPKS